MKLPPLGFRSCSSSEPWQLFLLSHVVAHPSSWRRTSDGWYYCHCRRGSVRWGRGGLTLLLLPTRAGRHVAPWLLSHCSWWRPNSKVPFSLCGCYLPKRAPTLKPCGAGREQNQSGKGHFLSGAYVICFPSSCAQPQLLL